MDTTETRAATDTHPPARVATDSVSGMTKIYVKTEVADACMGDSR